MAKKQLDTAGVINELTGQSAFFKRAERAGPPTPRRPKKEAKTGRKTVRRSERSQGRTEERSVSHPVELPVKRETKRYSFEFYKDQLVKLKQLKIRAELDGKSLSLSEMVRVALDNFLQGRET